MDANHVVGIYPGKFLRILFGDRFGSSGLRLEIRCIPTTAGDPVVRRFFRNLAEVKKGWTKLTELNRKKYEIFFGVVLRQKTKDGYEVPDPAPMTCIWVDIDVGADKPNNTIEDAKSRLRHLRNKPTVLVHSGHGLHAYWIFKKPRTITGEKAKRLLRGIAIATGGDLQSAEVARLLRMPGTINWKKGEEAKVLQMPNPSAHEDAQQ